LEAWSCFADGGYLVVARLTTAGTYDRRAAYFTHARAWRLEEVGNGFDPGALLGCSRGFERPWRDGESREEVEEPWPQVVRPEQVQAEAEVAESLLAHLFEARVEKRSVIFAVPVEELIEGGALHALVSFARAALPSELKISCHVRIYTRVPELFLGRLETDLLVLPESVAGDALGSKDDCVLLDRTGRVRAGRECSTEARSYAQAVVTSLGPFPQAALGFSERFQRHRLGEGLPTREELAAARITLLLSVAQEAPQRSRILPGLLRPDGRLPQLPVEVWGRLIDPEEWRSFPQDTLATLLLRDPSELLSGIRAFRRAAVEALRGNLGFLLNRSVGLGASDLQRTGLAAELLREECRAGAIVKRDHDPRGLAALGREPACRKELVSASAEGHLGPGWADALSGELGQEGDAKGLIDLFTELTERLLQAPEWGASLRDLLDELRRQEGLPRDLVERLGPAVVRLQRHAAEHLGLMARLADVWERGGGGSNPVARHLRSLLPEIGSPESRRMLVGLAFDQRFRCPSPALLVTQDGSLAARWLEEHAGRLMTSDQVRSRLSTEGLLTLGCRLGDTEAAPETDARRMFWTELDRRLRGQMAATTEALVRTGWWYFWRRGAEIRSWEPLELRATALCWLGCGVWGDVEGTLEAWERVVADLREISGAELAEACGDRSGLPGPTIRTFERRQWGTLCQLAGDLGALAELVERAGTVGLQPSEVAGALSGLLQERFEVNLTALFWLMPESGGQEHEEPLALETSRALIERSGHRQAAALTARIEAVVGHLKSEPREACRHADLSALWKETAFRRRLRTWLAGLPSISSLPAELLARLDQHLMHPASPAHGLEAASQGSGQERLAFLARQAEEAGYPALARFLSSGAAAAARVDRSVDAVARALTRGTPGDPCWEDFFRACFEHRTQLRHTAHRGRNPVSLLAQRLRDGDEEIPDNAWDELVLAAGSRLAQLFELTGGPGEGLPIFDLAAVLLEDRPLGALALFLAVYPDAGAAREDFPWWRELVNSLTRCQRRWGALTGEDRVDLARSLLAQVRCRLPAGEAQHVAAALARTHHAPEGQPGRHTPGREAA